MVIIWLNGTYGVGKTSVAREIKSKIFNQNAVVLESDDFFESMAKEIYDDMILNGGGAIPQNNKLFLERFKEKLELYMNSETICIVSNVYLGYIFLVSSLTMALTEKESIEILWDYLLQNSSDVCQFILEAEETIIEKRVKSDTKREQKDFALYELSRNIKFLDKNFKNIERIDTNNKTVENIAELIISKVGIIQ